MSLESYDPNIYKAVHVVEMTLQQWEYKGVLRFEVRGNVKGWDVLDSAPWHWLEENDWPDSVTLVDAEGNELSCGIDHERDLERMITGVRIVEVKPYE